jgi:hypothetical protein
MSLLKHGMHPTLNCCRSDASDDEYGEQYHQPEPSPPPRPPPRPAPPRGIAATLARMQLCYDAQVIHGQRQLDRPPWHGVWASFQARTRAVLSFLSISEQVPLSTAPVLLFLQLVGPSFRAGWRAGTAVSSRRFRLVSVPSMILST